MTKSKAPDKTRTPVGGPADATKAQRYEEARKGFFVAVLNMSWQLALVVLVPIVGGSQLDKALHSAPTGLLLGIFITIVGSVYVVWRQLQSLPSDVTKDGK